MFGIDVLAAATLVGCWCTVAVVWLGGALYGTLRAPRDRIRGTSTPFALIAGSVVACSVVLVFARGLGEAITTDSALVRVIGMVVLVVSTVFALWARRAIGLSWTVGPAVGGDRRLRTTGPYGVTRHPIYTGLVGMLLGTALLGGLGQWIVLVVVGVIVAEVKIHIEEALLLSVFADEYRRYRERVPQLVPGVRLIRRV
jgi:protein-S-isoprenylcysteine O-methyltransferase Ste14